MSDVVHRNFTSADLESRLSRLETLCRSQQRSLRRHRLILAGAAIVLCAGSLAALTVPALIPDVVQAKRFELLDDNGRVLMSATAGEQGGQIDLYSTDLHNVARFWVSEHGGDLAIWNRTGVNVFGAFATEEGGRAGFWNAEGDRGLNFTSDEQGGRIEVYGPGRQLMLEMAGRDEGGVIHIGNDQGQSVADLRAVLGGGELSIRRHDGGPSARITSQRQGGQFDIYGPQQQPAARLWSGEHGGDLSIFDVNGRNVLAHYATANGGEISGWNRDGQRNLRWRADEHRSTLSLSNGRIELTGRSGDDQHRTLVEIGIDRAEQAQASDGSVAGGYLRIAAGRHPAFAVETRENGGSQLALFNQSGTRVVGIDAVNSVGPSLAMWNREGMRQMLFGARPEGGVLNVMNQRGNAVLVAGASDDGSGGALSVHNADAQQVIHLGVSAVNDGIISIFDAEGRRRRVVRPVD